MLEDSEHKLRVAAVHPNGRRAFDPISKSRLIAACLEPGASVSQLALEHGVNANVVWKWIRQHRAAKKEAPGRPSPSAPVFIPVQIENVRAWAASKHGNTVALDLRADSQEVRRPEPAVADVLSTPAKINASLPNGVKLTLESGDVRVVTAIIRALCDVQAVR
jgi:transposase